MDSPFTDPWQQSKAALAMLRGMGLAQPQQQGAPINGEFGGGHTASMMPATRQGASPLSGLASQAQGLGGQISGLMVKDALGKRTPADGGVAQAEQAARDAMADKMMKSAQPPTALDRISGMADEYRTMFGPALWGA